MKILHLSDLHLTSASFSKELWENLLKLAHQKIKPDIVIISGDLVENGYISEYKVAKKLIDQIKIPKFIVPGNHDVCNEGDVLFEKFFGSRFFELDEKKVSILGVDSTQPDLEDGNVGREGYQKIKNFFQKRQNKIKILVLHHHLIPIPGTGRERSIPWDAGDLLKLLFDLNVNIVLSGHRHKFWVWKLEKTFFITSSTPTTFFLRGFDEPSCNLLEIKEKKFILKRVFSAQKKIKKILEKSL